MLDVNVDFNADGLAQKSQLPTYLPIYIIYTPNLGLVINVSVGEREQGGVVRKQRFWVVVVGRAQHIMSLTWLSPVRL